MFFILKSIRKIFVALKSDLTPNQIAAGFAIGVWIGLTPAGLHWLVPITLAFVLNCSLGACLLGFGIFKPLFIPLAPAAFRIGTWMLGGGHSWAEAIVRWAYEAPLLAWMGFNRYAVAGAYVLALPLAAALFLGMRIFVRVCREKVGPRLAGSATFQKAQGFFLTRWILRILTGKSKTPQGEDAPEPKKRFILFRPFRISMLVIIPVLALVISIATGLYVQLAIRRLTEKAIGKSMGVKCTFGDIAYAFFPQKFSFKEFQLPDPSNTGIDMARVGAFETKISFPDLLAGRFHLERLSIRDVTFHVVRKEDGSYNVTDAPGAKPSETDPPGKRAAWDEYIKWIQEHRKDVDWNKLLKKYLEYRERSAREAKERVALGYDPDLRWTPERTVPLFRADLIEVKNFSITFVDRAQGTALPSLTSVDVEGTGFSSKIGWAGIPMAIAGTGKLDDGKSGQIGFKLSTTSDEWQLETRLDGAPLTSFRSLYAESLPINVVRGALTIAARGRLSESMLDAAVNLRVDALAISARPGQPRLLGLNEEMSSYAIQGINAYGEKLPIVVGIAVTGPLSSPQVRSEMPFMEIAREGFKMLGKQILVDRMNAEIASLTRSGAGGSVPLEGDLGTTQQQVVKSIQTGDYSAFQSSIEKARNTDDLKKLIPDKDKLIPDLSDPFKKKD